MRTVTVPAIQDFEFQGRAFHTGDPVTVSPIHAAALRRQGFVSLDKQATYQTREIVPATPPPAPVPEPQPSEKRPRRRYRRRDLRAEE